MHAPYFSTCFGFTRWGPVGWWQPESIRPGLDGGACCHSPGVSPKELQLLCATLDENTCGTKTVSVSVEMFYLVPLGTGELTLGSPPLEEQRGAKEELVRDCEFSVWSVLSLPPPSAFGAAQAVAWDWMGHSAAIQKRENIYSVTLGEKLLLKRCRRLIFTSITE